MKSTLTHGEANQYITIGQDYHKPDRDANEDCDLAITVVHPLIRIFDISTACLRFSFSRRLAHSHDSFG